MGRRKEASWGNTKAGGRGGRWVHMKVLQTEAMKAGETEASWGNTAA